MKMRIYKIVSVLAVTMGLSSSCYKEEPIVPTPMRDDLLFEFPQDNQEYDRRIQKIHEQYGTYVIYKDIDQNLLNRAWINLYPAMTLVADPVKQEHINYYLDLLQAHLFDYCDSELMKSYFPKYFFLVNNLHLVDNGVSKAHMVAKTDGVDFWAFSLKEKDGAMQTVNIRQARLVLAYALIKNAFDEGKIQVPASFYEGIDYKNVIYDAIYSDGTAHEWHYQQRGFVKYVQPSFESEGRTTDIALVASDGEDFLMYVRKILYTAPAQFISEHSRWELIMKRYQIVLNLFNELGIDLSAIAEGPAI